MAAYLLSGSSVALGADDHLTIQQIADSLAGAGLRTVRLDELEWAAIENALAAHDGNRTHAAQSLGISLRTLQRRLRVPHADETPADEWGSDTVAALGRGLMPNGISTSP